MTEAAREDVGIRRGTAIEHIVARAADDLVGRGMAGDAVVARRAEQGAGLDGGQVPRRRCRIAEDDALRRVAAAAFGHEVAKHLQAVGRAREQQVAAAAAHGERGWIHARAEDDFVATGHAVAVGEGVVAPAGVEDIAVGAFAAAQTVVAGVADQGVVAGTAVDGVVAGQTVDGLVGVEAGEHVVAGRCGERAQAQLLSGPNRARVASEFDPLERAGGLAAAGKVIADAHHRPVVDDQHQVVGMARYLHVRRCDAGIEAQHIGFARSGVAGVERDLAVVHADQQQVLPGAEGHAVRALGAAACRATAQATAQDIVAGAAVEGVVAGTADQQVVAGTATELVVAAVASEHVGAFATIDDVGFAAARQGVVAGLAVQRVGARSATGAVIAGAGQHQVVAAQGIEHFVGVAQQQHVVELAAAVRAARQLVGVPGRVAVEHQAVDETATIAAKKAEDADGVTGLAGALALARLADVQQQVQAVAPHQHIGRGDAQQLQAIGGPGGVLDDDGVAAVATGVAVGVAARAALQEILAGVAGQGVVAGAAVQVVLPGAAAQVVLATQATQGVVAFTPLQGGVVAFAAGEGLVVARAGRRQVQGSERHRHRRGRQGGHGAECGARPGHGLGGDLGQAPARAVVEVDAVDARTQARPRGRRKVIDHAQLIGPAAQGEQQVVAGAIQLHVERAHGRAEQHAIDTSGTGVHAQPGVDSGAGAEANGVAAVAAAEHVVAGTTIEDVVAGAAEQLVAAVAADELVVALGAAEQVVAGATLQGVGSRAAGHHVVAAGDFAQAAAQLSAIQHRAVGELEAVDRRRAGGEPAAEQQTVGAVADLQHQVVALARGAQLAAADADAEAHGFARTGLTGVDDGVHAIAEIELEAVVAGAADQPVAAAAAAEHIVAGTAVQRIGTGAAGQAVVAGATEQRVLVVAALEQVVAVATVEGVAALAAVQGVAAAVAVHLVVAAAGVHGVGVRSAGDRLGTAIASGRQFGQAGRIDEATTGEIDATQVAGDTAVGVEKALHVQAVAAVAHADPQVVVLAAEGQVGRLQTGTEHQGVAALGVGDEIAAVAAAVAVVVVTVTAEQDVVAGAAVDEVVAVAAEQLVVAAAALQPVVAAKAVEAVGAVRADHPVALGMAGLGPRIAQWHEGVAAGRALAVLGASLADRHPPRLQQVDQFRRQRLRRHAVGQQLGAAPAGIVAEASLHQGVDVDQVADAGHPVGGDGAAQQRFHGLEGFDRGQARRRQRRQHRGQTRLFGQRLVDLLAQVFVASLQSQAEVTGVPRDVQGDVLARAIGAHRARQRAVEAALTGQHLEVGAAHGLEREDARLEIVHVAGPHRGGEVATQPALGGGGAAFDPALKRALVGPRVEVVTGALELLVDHVHAQRFTALAQRGHVRAARPGGDQAVDGRLLAGAVQRGKSGKLGGQLGRQRGGGVQVVDTAATGHLRQRQHAGADDDGRQDLARQVLRQVHVGGIADHGGAAAVTVGPAEAAQVGDAVAVVQFLAVAGVGYAQRFDAHVGQREQLAVVGNAVLVEVAPQAQVGKARVGGIDPTVRVGVFLRQRVEAIDRSAAECEGRGVAEQFLPAVDAAVAVAVERQEGVVGLDPARQRRDARAGGVEVDAASGVAGAGSFDAVAVEVEDQRVLARRHLEDVGLRRAGRVGFVIAQSDAEVAVGPLGDGQCGVVGALLDDQRVSVEGVAHIVGAVGVGVALAFAPTSGQQHPIEAHVALAVVILDLAADLDDVVIDASTAVHLVEFVAEQDVVAEATDEDVVARSLAAQDVVAPVTKQHVVAIVAVKSVIAEAPHDERRERQPAGRGRAHTVLRWQYPFAGAVEPADVQRAEVVDLRQAAVDIAMQPLRALFAHDTSNGQSKRIDSHR